MSIYSTQVSTVSFADVQALLTDQANETIRLEFKREIPPKDELLKQISSFANTYGGYIVLGVEEDAQGRAVALPGVEPAPGFHQKVIQWCYDGMYPPLTPFISPPIEKPGDPASVFYVIYVSESYEAPHFINGRKGCYIRTDDNSQRFQPLLATHEEITHLSNRRSHAIDVREALIARARSRFEAHVKQSYHAKANVLGEMDFTMWMAIVPTFPPVVPIDIPHLEKAIAGARLQARQDSFPLGQASSQLDGFFFSDPRAINFGYLEVDQQGLVFYAEEMAYVKADAMPQDKTSLESYEPTPSDIYVYATWILAWIIFYLKYAHLIYHSVGYDGPVLLRLGLDRIKGRQVRVALDSSGNSFEEGKPLLDDALSIERTVLSSRLVDNLLAVSKDLFRAATFACGWTKAYSASDDFIEFSVDQALKYLMWKRSDIASPHS
jgi:hypothetical protein